MEPRRKRSRPAKVATRTRGRRARVTPPAPAISETALERLRNYQDEIETQNEELRRSQLELEESRDLYADLYDLAPVGYVTLRTDGMIRDLNLTASRLLGVERRWVVGYSFTMRVLQEQTPVFRKFLLECHRAPEGSKLSVEVDLRVPGARSLPAELISHVTISRQDGSKVIRMTIIDLSERRRLDAEKSELLRRERDARIEAEAANRAKDQFLAIVSHELRTPLQPILTWTQLLRRPAITSETIKKASTVIERCALTQAQIVDDLLDVARVIWGKIELRSVPLELREIVDSALELCRFEAEAAGVNLELKAVRAPIRLRGDSRRLQQIVWNLVKNAIKFTPKGGHVKVSLKADPKSAQAIITVADTGQGIPAAFLPHVFDRFAQLDSSPSRAKGGLGLGLFIVHSLVEAHGGRITVASEGSGKGSTFTVYLPIAP